jgi:dihydrofolate reductase
MRISAFCGVSVDGYLARLDDTFDFLKVGEGVPHGFSEFLKSVDVVVMGRRTFEVVRSLGHLELYGGKPMIILSSSPLQFKSVIGEIEQMSGTPQELVAQLEGRGFKHAYVDGGITIQAFLKSGLLDDITITRVPVLIGQGIPLFGSLPRDIPLQHLRTQSCKGGLVQTEYRAKKR